MSVLVTVDKTLSLAKMSLTCLQNCCISVRHICAGAGGRLGLFFIGWWGEDYWLLLKMIPSKLLQGLLWLIKPESSKMYYNSSCCLEIILFDPDASIWSAVQRKEEGRRKFDGKSLKPEGEEIYSISLILTVHVLNLGTEEVSWPMCLPVLRSGRRIAQSWLGGVLTHWNLFWKVISCSWYNLCYSEYMITGLWKCLGRACLYESALGFRQRTLISLSWFGIFCRYKEQ